MGTSLSGLTPATTFDGLLKVGDNDPLTATLKPISTGDGTDTMLELSTSALQIGGATGMYWDNTNKRLGLNDVTPTSKIDIKNTFGASALSQLDRMGLFVGYTSASFGIALGGTSSYTSGLVQGTNNIGNASGTLSLNPFGSDVGVGSVSPTAKLHIKGSGATSATTSLLVQNSAGTNIFKVVDDNTMFYHTHKFRSAGGYLYIEGEGNADRSLKVGQNFTASSYDGHIFKTYDGVAYSEAMRITGANDQRVGIGEPTPTARLHVKAGTTQDSIAKFEDPRATTDYIEIKNDSTLTDYTGLYWGTRAKIRSKQAGAMFLDCAFGISFADGNTAKSKIDANGNMSVGVATIPASTRMTIKGQGATSATTSLLVQDSAGTDLLKVSDDGSVFIGLYEYFGYNSNNSIRFGTGEYIQNMQGTTSSNKWSLRDSSTGYAFLQAFSKSRKVAINLNANNADTDVNAQLHVKGAGNTDATTSLLVQNSDGTDMVKVTDDGVTTIQGNVDALGGDVAIFQNNTDPTNQFKINKKDNSNNIWHTGTTNTEIQYRDNIHFRFNHGGVTQMQLRNTGNLGLGIGGSNASARMHVKGSGATSATTALLVENSSGTDTLEVRDDGRVVAGTGATTNANGTFNVLHGTSNLTTRVFTVSRDSVLRGMDINSGGSTKISDSSGDQSFSHTATAVFEVSSTTQGFLPPRMTGTQRDAIESPASGLIIYNTTTNKAQCYNGTSWNDMF